MNHLLGTGWAIGLETLTGFQFRADRPYRACLICGRLFQTAEDRDLSTCNSLSAVSRRRTWALLHAREHPDREHRLLRLSGLAMTPEAANKLAAYGLIDIGGLVVEGEITAAYGESKSVPVNDADF